MLLCLSILLVSAFSTVILQVKAQEEYPREQTVIAGTHSEMPNPENWNWMSPGNYGQWFRGMSGTILEQLFYINYYTDEWIPWIATDYAYNDNYTELTFVIRDDVTWSDGTPFTVDDCVFTYDLHLNSPELLLHSPEIRSTISDVVEVNATAFTVYLINPNPRAHIDENTMSTHNIFGQNILPKHIWEDHFDTPTEFTFYPPIGTGPYELVSAETTRWVMQRRDDYWGTEVWGIRPAPKYIIWIPMGTEDVTAMQMIGHEMDHHGMAVPGPGVAQDMVEQSEYITSWTDGEYPHSFIDPGIRYIELNFEKYPWNNIDARRGLSYLINREDLETIALEGTANRSLWFTETAIMQNYLDEIDDLMDQYEPLAFNQTKAFALFEGLGWTRGVDDVWVTENGTRVEIELLVFSTHFLDPKTGQVIVNNWIDGGIDAVLTPMVSASVGEFVDIGDFSAAQLLIISSIDPLPGLEEWITDFYQPVGNYSTRNGGRYYNENLTDLVYELRSLSPEDQWEEVAQVFHDSMEILLRDVVAIPMCQNPWVMMFDTYYWDGWPTVSNPYSKPTNWLSSHLFYYTGYQSPAHDGEWWGGIYAVNPTTETVTFTESMTTWRAVDGNWYGPYNSGDTATVPSDDADWLVSKNVATTEEPEPEPTGFPLEYIAIIVVIIIIVLALVFYMRR
jgi:peptide/nickel transport system substrate-binding protein